MTAEYRLFKRKSGKTKIYYARILDPEGNVVKTVSTGEGNQYRAHDWAKAHIEEYLPGRKDPTLREYAERETLGRNSRKGEYLSPRRCSTGSGAPFRERCIFSRPPPAATG
jgi:hypothetical protein